ncbi:DUF389 domain-containing protein [Actinomadura craniellae]|uniref:DUF389 domain-containing protein n=1 Tax=Actinomadura craniellae TaxID=2231787 RepID=A0A365H8U4_9ACTN|nr:DUF389 domain-containing protein [Actinomadura craniellae]RAY15459.1 DUF389 domain-containing protein [Actinomadura craniellae]
MLRLQAIVPKDRTEQVCTVLAGNPGATHIAVFSGAARDPAGDVVTADIARESANEILAALRSLRLDRDGSLTLEHIDISLSKAAEDAERRAPGAPDDAVVWADLDQRTADAADLTWSFIAFLTLATLLAGIAALLDSPILIVGAMVLGPEFGAVAAIAFGLVFWKPGRVAGALRTLAVGFAVAIAITYVCALLGRWTGVIELAELPDARPLTGFVYEPDRWSFIVAVLAGAAGVLALTADKSSSLVGVFISVTTVPAAGNIAVAVALRHWSEVAGSAVQLLVNLVGMVIAGVATMVVQRAAWGFAQRRTKMRPKDGTG